MHQDRSFTTYYEYMVSYFSMEQTFSFLESFLKDSLENIWGEIFFSYVYAVFNT